MSRIACPPRLHVMDRPALPVGAIRALGRRSIRGRRRRRAPGGPALDRAQIRRARVVAPGDGGADRRVAGSAIVVDERLREVDLGGRGAHLRPVQARWPELAEQLLPATPRSTGPAETAAAVRTRIAPVAGDLRAADLDTIIVTTADDPRPRHASWSVAGPVRTHPVQPGGIVVLTRRDCRARQRSNDDATVRDDRRDRAA